MKNSQTIVEKLFLIETLFEEHWFRTKQYPSKFVTFL